MIVCLRLYEIWFHDCYYIMTVMLSVDEICWHRSYCYHLTIIFTLGNKYRHNLAWLNVYYYYYLCDMLYVNLQRSYHALRHFRSSSLVLFYFTSLFLSLHWYSFLLLSIPSILTIIIIFTRITISITPIIQFFFISIYILSIIWTIHMMRIIL